MRRATVEGIDMAAYTDNWDKVKEVYPDDSYHVGTYISGVAYKFSEELFKALATGRFNAYDHAFMEILWYKQDGHVLLRTTVGGSASMDQVVFSVSIGPTGSAVLRTSSPKPSVWKCVTSELTELADSLIHINKMGNGSVDYLRMGYDTRKGLRRPYSGEYKIVVARQEYQGFSGFDKFIETISPVPYTPALVSAANVIIKDNAYLSRLTAAYKDIHKGILQRYRVNNGIVPTPTGILQARPSKRNNYFLDISRLSVVDMKKAREALDYTDPSWQVRVTGFGQDDTFNYPKRYEAAELIQIAAQIRETRRVYWGHLEAFYGLMGVTWYNHPTPAISGFVTSNGSLSFYGYTNKHIDASHGSGATATFHYDDYKMFGTGNISKYINYPSNRRSRLGDWVLLPYPIDPTKVSRNID